MIHLLGCTVSTSTQMDPETFYSEVNDRHGLSTAWAPRFLLLATASLCSIRCIIFLFFVWLRCIFDLQYNVPYNVNSTDASFDVPHPVCCTLYQCTVFLSAKLNRDEKGLYTFDTMLKLFSSNPAQAAGRELHPLHGPALLLQGVKIV
jgi:hypothetical protein